MKMGFLKSAWLGTNEEKALKSVEKLNDQEKLKTIVKESPLWRVQVVALNKLTDQVALADIAKNNIPFQTRLAAVKKLEDQSILAAIAKNDKNTNVCIAAMEKLSDPLVITDIIRNGKNRGACLCAIEKISDQSVLATIAADANIEIRLCESALKRIIDPALLRQIAYNDGAANSVRSSVIDKLGLRLIELTQEQLASIVYANWLDNHKKAMEALNLITDQSILKRMSYWKQGAFGGDKIGVAVGRGVLLPLWEVACSKITDRTILQEIMTTANVSVTAHNAKKRLQELNDGRI